MNRARPLLLFIHFLFASSHQFSTTTVTFRDRRPEKAEWLPGDLGAQSEFMAAP
jgi:hypothetical protein